MVHNMESVYRLLWAFSIPKKDPYIANVLPAVRPNIVSDP